MASRSGYWRENWGVESITPHPISVFDDEELRRLERQYKKALASIKPGNVPKAQLLDWWVPPHQRYKDANAFNPDTHHIKLNKRGEWVLFRYNIGSPGTGKGWKYVGLEKLEPWEYGPPAPIYEKKVRVIGRPPVQPPRGASAERWVTYYKAELLWQWKWTDRSTYYQTLRQAKELVNTQNEARREDYEERKQKARKQVRIAKRRLQEWYTREYRRIERAYSGDQYRGRIVRNPYGVTRR